MSLDWFAIFAVAAGGAVSAVLWSVYLHFSQHREWPEAIRGGLVFGSGWAFVFTLMDVTFTHVIFD